MPLTTKQKNNISKLLTGKIENKLKRYARESTSMPFLVRLMQDKEKVASYSFIHSLATTLGMSIYEAVSKIIVEESVTECFTRYDLGGALSKEQKSVIGNIIAELRNGERECDIKKEIEEVLAADASNGKYQKEGRIADFYMLRDGVEQYFEIKTAKPNIDVVSKTKQKLLEWVARKRKNVKVYLAIPYNPYHPEPYDRFTLKGIFDIGKDVLVGKDYWDYLGGNNTYEDLLSLFDKTGIEFKDRIQEKIKEVANEKLNI